MESAATGESSPPGTVRSPQWPQPLSTEGLDFAPGRPWYNMWNVFTGRISEAGLERFRLDRDLRNEEDDCKRCEKHRDYLLAYSPIVRFMRENINQLGADVNSTNVQCRRCDDLQEGGFNPNYGIRICANWVKEQAHTEDVMAHEMVHAWDHVRFKMDYNNLKHAACTEIRASSLSGECRFLNEFWTRGNMKLTQQHQECVKRRAVHSLMDRPNCQGEEHAKSVVNQVWESCFTDTRPFDEIYR